MRFTIRWRTDGDGNNGQYTTGHYTVSVPNYDGGDVVTSDEHERLRASFEEFVDRVEVDRREPDKILCHVLTARRALTLDSMETPDV